MQWLKSLLVGGPGVVLKLGGDILLAMIGHIGWRIIFERLLTRVVAGCLKWLATLSTNNIYQSTVTDILKDFESRGLVKAVAYEDRRLKRDQSGH